MGHMQVNGQKVSFLTREAGGGNNGQTINDARTNSKNKLASVLKGNSSDKISKISTLFSAPDKVSVTNLQKLANVVEVLTVIGRDHAGSSKYNYRRGEMPTRSDIIRYMKSIGIVEGRFPREMQFNFILKMSLLFIT